MKDVVLVIGNGGREHALVHGIALSSNKPSVYACPGNGGTSTIPNVKNVTLKGHSEIIAFCQKNDVTLVVIGPELPLIEGLSNALRNAGISTMGASQAAAQIESSKSFATEFMQTNAIPIPESYVVHTIQQAEDAVAKVGGPTQCVIKADGYAGGKGVFLPDTAEEASHAISDIAAGRVDADGSRFVIQNRHSGPEVSIFVLSDGTDYHIIPIASQDHKRLLAGDSGPNTGGMGVYAPLPDWMLSQDQWLKIDTIAKQTIDGMNNRGTPYQGVLYIGLMLSEQLHGDPIVIEYNARFGDPEAEVLIPLLMRNGVDILDLAKAVAAGSLSDIALPKVIDGAALTICLAVPGYPKQPQPGQVIKGLDRTYTDVIVFHGGTSQSENGETITSGGRALYITGMGNTLQAASTAANNAIGENAIHFEGMQYRHDIGHRAFSGPSKSE